MTRPGEWSEVDGLGWDGYFINHFVCAAPGQTHMDLGYFIPPPVSNSVCKLVDEFVREIVLEWPQSVRRPAIYHATHKGLNKLHFRWLYLTCARTVDYRLIRQCLHVYWALYWLAASYHVECGHCCHFYRAMHFSTGLFDVSYIVRKRRLGLFGHVARLRRDVPANQILQICTKSRYGERPSQEWRRACGRPSTTWTHQICRDTGVTAIQALQLAEDRPFWRTIATAGGSG